MKIVDRLEDTLNGGYGGLEGEVVGSDTYRLKQVKFIPDIVFDVGGNVGTFTRFAKSLFPLAMVISVEPNPENCIHFRKFTPDSGVWLLEMALGRGPIYRATTAQNGAGESYVSVGLGYPEVGLKQTSTVELADVPTISLADLINAYLRPGKKSILKMDCEGGENCVWGHEPSMRAIQRIDYLAFELHDYALTTQERQAVLAETNAGLKQLEATHVCKREGVYFWATKKELA